MNKRDCVVPFPTRATEFFVLQNIVISSEDHAAFYTVGTGGLFYRGKEAGK